MAGRVLIVDDDREMCDALMAELPTKGYSGSARTSADEAFRLLETEEFDVVVTDINLGGSNGIDLCAKIAANRPDTPVVVITAFGSMQAAIEAIRAGAYDFVTKPFDMPTLALALNRAVQHRTLRHEVRRLRQEVDTTRMIGQVTGESAAMKPVRQLIERVADSDASVLITGESGTGKERVARALHRTGRRKDAPMIPINCAALPESLLESELFGHVKGAFTDARTPHAGLFVQAHGGTLFLDEIGDMPLPLQAKLLRALQERRVRPVGGSSETPFDVRLVTATNRNLELAVEAKTFREDLFFRVNVIQIDLPPLRARGNDILVLAQHFIQTFADQAGKPIRGLSPGTAEKLLAYSWPGNVRELRNYMERAVALTHYEEVTVEDLPAKVRSYRRSDLLLLEGLDPAELPALEEMERRYVLRVMESVGGNRGQAARILDLDRKTLYRRLDRYGYKEPPTPEARRDQASGTVKVNVLPSPSWLSTQSVPPCASTRHFEMYSPSPRPRRSSLPACQKRSNTDSSMSPGCPGRRRRPRNGPGSHHLGPHAERSTCSGELDRVRDQVGQHLQQPVVIEQGREAAGPPRIAGSGPGAVAAPWNVSTASATTALTSAATGVTISLPASMLATSTRSPISRFIRAA